MATTLRFTLPPVWNSKTHSQHHGQPHSAMATTLRFTLPPVWNSKTHSQHHGNHTQPWQPHSGSHYHLYGTVKHIVNTMATTLRFTLPPVWSSKTHSQHHGNHTQPWQPHSGSHYHLYGAVKHLVNAMVNEMNVALGLICAHWWNIPPPPPPEWVRIKRPSDQTSSTLHLDYCARQWKWLKGHSNL